MLLATILALWANPVRAQSAHPQDSLALVAFYHAAGGADWEDSTGWLEEPVRDWYGVRLNEEGRVVTLWMSDNNLTGSIPPELGNLTALEYLSFYRTSLTKPIPASLGRLKKLKSLWLGDTGLTYIPKVLGNFEELEYLGLERNALTGPIPTWLANFANLKRLNLSDNGFTGSIPPELGNLTELEYLDLGSNTLTGSIPSALSNLTELEYLDLGSNTLTGSIPSTLGNLTELEYLDLGSNTLTGSIPSTLGNLAELEYLGLYVNELTGPVPASLMRFAKLKHLNLGHNALTGSIPSTLGNLAELEYLDLRYNDLDGSIPTSLEHLTKLERLWLSYNRLTGPIPPGLGNLVELEYLDLGYNDLDDSIPASVEHLTKLERLWLSYNRLTGPIPRGLGNLAELEDLNLQANALTGPIPPSLGKLSRLQYLFLDGNALTGSIPPLGNLSNLVELSLYDNPLAPYDFPKWITNLGNLRFLSLGSTRLRGVLPGNIVTAKGLMVLYLHQNNLDALGDLCGLRELSSVDITFNRLTFEDFEDLDECDDPVIVFKSSQEPDREHLAALFERTGFVTEADGPHEAIRITARRRPDLEALRQYIDILDALQKEGKGDVIPAGHLRVLPRLYRRLAERAERFSESEAEQTSVHPGNFRYAPQQSVPLRVVREAGHVTFSVDVGGEANEYQWYRGDDPDRTDDEPITGETSNTLRVPLPEARGVYYCKITNPHVPDLTLYSKRASSSAPEHIVVAHEQDSLALVAFYHATGGPNWTNDRDWLKGPLERWYGVSLNGEGRVRGLHSENNNLTGFLPEEVGSLAKIEHLDLEFNEISGPLPESLGNLTSLTSLYLGWNNFRGTIPASLGNLTQMEYLRLYGNRLRGPIPEALNNLTSLEALVLGYNNLTGQLSAWLGNLPRLTHINLGHNDITGRIPEELGNLATLKWLRLNSNNLTGPIPEALGNLTSLITLDIGHNNLNGSIPASLGRLTRLERLNLERNALEGAVPDNILALESLSELSLSYNRFTSLPDFTGMSKLDQVSVFSNRLTFEDVEQQERFRGEYFRYAPQAAVPVHATRSASHVTFSVEVGGTANKYQWRREGLQGEEAIPGATADTLAVPLSEPPTYYWCEITNAKAPELTLYSERAYPEEIYTSAEREEDVLTFAVHANYPNPFSEATEIAFEAPEVTHVRITVYDMLGRRVETAYDRTVSPGRYRVAYSAGDLAPGTYFYHVEMGRFRETRAMMLVR